MADIAAFDGLRLTGLARHGDDRGYLFETFSPASPSGGTRFVQDNVVFSARRGTLRGLHFQTEPFSQAKLVTVLDGAIFDVVVDLRPGSPTYFQWFGTELSSRDLQQLFIPAGFAHGFCTLSDKCLVTYKMSAPYSAQHERGIIWNDPDLAIAWPLGAGEEPILSEKDRLLPRARAP